MARQPQATNNRVIVDPVKDDNKEGRRTEGGILIPESVDGLQHWDHNGIITSVGPDVTDERLKPGAEIVYNPRSGQEIKAEKHAYLVMRDADILAVIVDDEKPNLELAKN